MLPKLYAEQKMEEAVLSFESSHGPHKKWQKNNINIMNFFFMPLVQDSNPFRNT
jgi:hypothetical protein